MPIRAECTACLCRTWIVALCFSIWRFTHIYIKSLVWKQGCVLHKGVIKTCSEDLGPPGSWFFSGVARSFAWNNFFRFVRIQRWYKELSSSSIKEGVSNGLIFNSPNDLAALHLIPAQNRSKGHSKNRMKHEEPHKNVKTNQHWLTQFPFTYTNSRAIPPLPTTTILFAVANRFWNSWNTSTKATEVALNVLKK